jgi:hypothetical protein
MSMGVEAAPALVMSATDEVGATAAAAHSAGHSSASVASRAAIGVPRTEPVGQTTPNCVLQPN